MTTFELVRDFAARQVCHVCWDTGVVLKRGGFERCGSCSADRVEFTAPALRLAETIWRRVEKKQPVDNRAFFVARVLTHATSERPAPRQTLMAVAQVSERGLKDIARTLRREWLLPIGSSRGTQEGQPAGYFWMARASDYLTWSRPFRAQAIDELVTEYRMRLANFPELTGQGSLEFVNEVQRQIEEALV